MDIRPPASLHEAEIERHLPRDPVTLESLPDEDLRGLASAMAAARRSAEQLSELAAALRTDPTRTPAAAAAELRKQALSVGERAAAALDTARQRAGEALRRVEAETAPPPPRDAVAARLESEIRARLAAMPATERRQAIAAAVKGGEDLVIGAVLRGPALLVAMDPVEHDHLRDQWRHSWHPDEAAKLDRLSKAIEATDTGGNLLVSYVERMAGTHEARQAEAQAGATESVLQALRAAE